MTAPCFTVTGLGFKMKICSWHSAAYNSSFAHCCSEINSRMPKRGMVLLQLPMSHRLRSSQQRWCASLYFTCCLLYITSFGPLFLSSPVPACYNCSSFQTSSSVNFLKQFLGHPAGVALACPCLSLPSSLTASFGEILLIVLLDVNTSVSTTRLYFLFFFLNVHLGTGPELAIYYTLYHSITQQSFLCFALFWGA